MKSHLETALYENKLLLTEVVESTNATTQDINRLVRSADQIWIQMRKQHAFFGMNKTTAIQAIEQLNHTEQLIKESPHIFQEKYHSKVSRYSYQASALYRDGIDTASALYRVA